MTLGAGVTRQDHPDALLQHARGARHQRPRHARRGPTSHGTPALVTGLRRAAAGLVHVVPRGAARATQRATTTRPAAPRGPPRGWTCSGAGTVTTTAIYRRSWDGSTKRPAVVEHRRARRRHVVQPGGHSAGREALDASTSVVPTTRSGSVATTGRRGSSWTARSGGRPTRALPPRRDAARRSSTCSLRGADNSDLPPLPQRSPCGRPAGPRSARHRAGRPRRPAAVSNATGQGSMSSSAAATPRSGGRHGPASWSGVDERRRSRDVRARRGVARHGQARPVHPRRRRRRSTTAPTTARAGRPGASLGGATHLGPGARSRPAPSASTSGRAGPTTPCSTRSGSRRPAGAAGASTWFAGPPRLVRREVRVPLAERPEGAPELALRAPRRRASASMSGT